MIDLWIKIMLIVEGRLKFKFECDAMKLDDSRFYRDKFVKIQSGIKYIDILAVNGRDNYFIEIKDYSHPKTTSLKSNEFISSIVKKVIDSLAILFPMKICSYTSEVDIASKVLSNDNLTLILHIEKPTLGGKLKQSKWNESNISIKIKQQLQGILKSVKFTSIAKSNTLPWYISTI